ncbi:MAG: DUF5655 domain-containing protein [Pseudomonadota bacterium]
MTQEYEDKERDFLVNLKADTGRDLAEWMQAIADADIADRNDRIDWFRQEGFIFSWASWMERIHHNGGRPIYLDAVPGAEPQTEPTPDHTALETQVDPRGDVEAAAAPDAPPAFDPLAALPAGTIKTSDPERLSQTVASAKAYAPLMTFLLGQVAQRLPDAFAVPGSDYVVLNVSKRRAAPFALISITQSDLKLGLQLGSWPIKPPMEKARFQGGATKSGKSLTHMVSLTDARQIEAGLVNLIEAAHTRTKGR